MNNHVDDIITIVGNAGTPLRKLPPQERKELRRILESAKDAQENLPKELLLRAYLLIGQPMLPEIKSSGTIAAALTMKDTLQYLNKLVNKKSYIDAVDTLQSLAEMMRKREKNKINITMMNLVIRKLWNLFEKNRVEITEETRENILIIIHEVLSSIPSPNNLNDKTLKKYGSFLKPTTELLLNVAETAHSAENYKLAFEIIKSSQNKFPSLILNDIFATDNVQSKVEKFRNRTIEILHENLLNGNSESFIKLYNACKDFDNLGDLIKERLSQVWFNQGATLKDDIQQTLKTLLYEEMVKPKVYESVRKSDDSTTKQFAAVLLSAWDARNDGPHALDTYKLLKSVSENYINIKLGEDVGSVVGFNKIGHEVLNNELLTEGSMVEILRPWVEYQDDVRKSVVIKALVKPASQGGGKI